MKGDSHPSQELLEKEKVRLELAIKAAQVGVWDWDVQTNDLYWSDRFKEIVGIEDGEFSAHYEDFAGRLHPEDKEATLSMLQAHLESQVPYNVEYRLRRVNGDYIWIHARGEAIRAENGSPTRMIGTVVDISGRKEAEEKARKAQMTIDAFIDASSDGYWDWHIQEDYEYMSPRLWEILGYKPEEKRHHPSEWQALIHEEDLPLTLKNYEKHVNTKGKYPFWQEVRYWHKDGHLVTLVCKGRVVEWDGDQPMRMIGSHSDISDRKAKEIQIKGYADALQRSNQELEDFAHIASHDLKEPLRGLQTYATMLAEDYKNKLDDEAAVALQRIENLAKRMEGLITDLLAYSGVAQIDFAIQKHDLRALLSEVMDLLHEQVEENNAEVTIADNLPTITADGVKIGEVFRNLITNAMKYNQSDKKSVVVGGTTHPKVPNQTVFYVSDNGIGIKQKHHDSIFKIFRRLHAKEKYGGGTGSGLAIVKKIIERHEGEIWVESEEGEGTTFFFTVGASELKARDSRTAMCAE